MTVPRWSGCLVLVLAAAGCVPIPGDPGEPCSSQGLCGPDLVCDQNNRCVSLESNLCIDKEEGLCYDPDTDVEGYDCGWKIEPNDAGDHAAMCLVTAGTYPIGNPGTDTDVGGFHLDRFEVTNQRYLSFLNAQGDTTGLVPVCNPDPVGKSWTESPLAFPAGTDHHPVVCVTREQARAFCSWAGKRLPTGTEWEAAARGAGAGPYPWGADTPVGKANCFDDACHDTYPFSTCQASQTTCADTAPVTTLEAGTGPFGQLHLAGNASERVEEGNTVRGGSWDDCAVDLFTELAVWWTGEYAAAVATVGFRCAL